MQTASAPMPPSSYSTFVPSSSLATSSYRDRTTEFLSIAERLKKAPGGPQLNGDSSPSGQLAVPPAGHPSATSAQSEFNRHASRIGLSIHQTTQKLQKLAKLARRTSMFDDPSAEVADLTGVIKQDITALTAAISDLQALCDAAAEAGGGGNRGGKQRSEHSTTVVESLKGRLMATTKEFKDVLTLRTQSLKVHENRRQLFSATSSVHAPPQASARLRPAAAVAAAANAASSSAPPPPWASSTASATSSSSSSAMQLFNNPSSRRYPFDPMQQQQQSQALLPQAHDSYMTSRQEALQNVETTIVELSGIFRDLATMVAQQGEMAIRIDQDMEDTLTNVEGAQGALLKYLNNISSNRWLIIKIFFVLIVFLLIFVIFVA